jgi:hypothetical protein
MSRKEKLQMIAGGVGMLIFIIAFLYAVLLGLWKLHYPVCIPGYAPEIFRVADDDFCVYKSLVEMAEEQRR